MQRKQLKAIINSCWCACTEADPRLRRRLLRGRCYHCQSSDHGYAALSTSLLHNVSYPWVQYSAQG